MTEQNIKDIPSTVKDLNAERANLEEANEKAKVTGEPQVTTVGGTKVNVNVNGYGITATPEEKIDSAV